MFFRLNWTTCAWSGAAPRFDDQMTALPSRVLPDASFFAWAIEPGVTFSG